MQRRQKIVAEDHKLRLSIILVVIRISLMQEHCFVHNKNESQKSLTVHFRECDANNGGRLTGVTQLVISFARLRAGRDASIRCT